MNQRDSSGLPLRAMVMVLLFLGVVFLLVGFQAMGSSDDDDGSSSSSTTHRHVDHRDLDVGDAPHRAAAKADVRVYNISEVAGLADRDAPPGCATPSGTSPRPGTSPCEGVTATTVYFGEAPGEKEAADEIGAAARRARRTEDARELAEQPPGVIVAVTG